ncbi:MAG: phosphoglucosamine mutase [Oscillospiraceae bacterium]|jgi:phosphoglucosamine mutase|nr:phosphoglucosamine mutase [Oscillospiraceae bacterium]
MPRLFGTDGIRGIANIELDVRLAYRTGQAAAMALAAESNSRPVFVIGKDTRISGDMLETAFISGLCASGANVMRLGIVPTPAVAHITTELKAHAGVVISASHNPYQHNGIKIFNSRGFKLSDALEDEIERLVNMRGAMPMEVDENIGHVLWGGITHLERYITFLRSIAKPGRRIKVVLDLANGAAVSTAYKVFEHFVDELHIINDNPDGLNINDGCGSTSPGALSDAVLRTGSDVGFAFDGDADRVIACDEKGNIIDGDKVLGICARHLISEGKLPGNLLVSTVMSNLGLRKYCKEGGVELLTTDVGDRNVLEAMLEKNAVLGGEQSGHIIFLNDATTGDGQLAALKFLNAITLTDLPVSEIVRDIPTYPQVLRNVQLPAGITKEQALESPALTAAIAKAEGELDGNGRILVRASGTENLIRVMVEAQFLEIAENLAMTIALAVLE